MMLRMNIKNNFIFESKLEEIQQSKRVDDDGGGGVSGGRRRRRSGHRSRDTRDENGQDGEAGIGVGDGAIGSRRRKHPRGNDKKGRNRRFDGSGRREMRVIGGGEGTLVSTEGGRLALSTSESIDISDVVCITYS